MILRNASCLFSKALKSIDFILRNAYNIYYVFNLRIIQFYVLIVKPENNMTETEHVECYPVPDYVEEKGRLQGDCPDSSIVYIHILWTEFEPQEGVYRYEFIEDVLRKARENKQR